MAKRSLQRRIQSCFAPALLCFAMGALNAACSEAEPVPVPIADAESYLDPPPRETPDSNPGPIHFTNATARIPLGDRGGRGVALVDINGDGWLDISISANSYLYLFRGVGDGLFRPWYVTEMVQVRAPVWVDIDDDGDLDMFASTNGNVAYVLRNEGNDQFTELEAEEIGIRDLPQGGRGATFADIDRDGDLDLYIAFGRLRADAYPDGRPPPGTGGQPNRLYRNEGGGQFSLVDTPAVGFDQGETFVGVFWDVDDDLWPDLLVAHDMSRDQFFRNVNGTFVEESTQRLPSDGQADTSIMGVDLADFDGDGRLDLLATEGDDDLIYSVQPDGRLVDRWREVITDYDPTAQLTGWGTAWVDIDEDGDVDVISTSAYETLFDGVEGALRQGWMYVLRHDHSGWGTDGQHTLLDISTEAGSFTDRPIDGWGLAVGDIDNDGDPDILVGVDGTGDKTDADAHPQALLLLNDSLDAQRHNSLQLLVKQPGRLNQWAVGALITISGDGLSGMVPIMQGSSYLSSSSYMRHFGIGERTVVPRVTVRWPDGHQTVWLDLPAGRHVLERPTGTCCTLDGCSNIAPNDCQDGPRQ